jgi:hypothetical protein
MLPSSVKPSEKSWINSLRSVPTKSTTKGQRPVWEPIALLDITPEPIPRQWVGPQPETGNVLSSSTLPTGMHELRQNASNIANNVEVLATAAKLVKGGGGVMLSVFM